jgi:hypothetical protein
MPETNEQGQVALRYYTTTPHVIRVGGIDYAFAVKANICLAWINPEHVNTVLGMKHHCCGNSYNQAYFYANESAVRRWTNGGGR